MIAAPTPASSSRASSARRATLGEGDAKRLALLYAVEAPASPDSTLWTAADREAVTRAARETTPAEAGPEVFLAERARHAAHRLAQRRPEVNALLRERPGPGALAAWAAAGGLLAGLLLDGLTAQQRINLLAPPLWGVLAWNVVVLAALAVRGLLGRGVPGPLRRLLAGWREGTAVTKPPQADPLLRFRTQWALDEAPLQLQRLVLGLHLAAAGLALGLVAGLYLRGLAWDYRAGWESTWLDATTVQALLATVLAPASALTGIAVPDAAAIAALRLAPGAAAGASAAPWLHLLAATLLLFVVLPRLVLAAIAGIRLAWRRAHWPVDLADERSARLVRQWQRRDESIFVLPHGSAVGAAAALGLRQVAAAVFGDKVQVQFAATTPYGDEVDNLPALQAVPRGATLIAMWAELAATPEAEAQGRLLAALRAHASAAGLGVLLLLDESAWQRRFAGLPQRQSERLAAWRALAEPQHVPVLCAAFEAPDVERAAAALERALANGAAAVDPQPT